MFFQIVINSFSIVSESKVLKYLNSLDIKITTGLDGIPSRFVRDGASIIACPLTHVINLSLVKGVVPDDLKSARVTYLYLKTVIKQKNVIIDQYQF